MKTYILTSIKGNRSYTGTCAGARKAAREMRDELQPAFGVDVELDGIRLCTAQ